MQMNMEKIKPVLMGAVGGGIVLAVIGFAWGGWVTGGTAQEMAEELAQRPPLPAWHRFVSSSSTRIRRKIRSSKK